MLTPYLGLSFVGISTFTSKRNVGKKVREKAFRKIIADHQEMVQSICLGIMKNIEEAEDMKQEVFIHVYQNIEQFKGEAKLSTWIYRIASNKCLEELRKRSRQKRAAILEDINEGSVQSKAADIFHPQVAMEDTERAKILFSAIKNLPEQQQKAFTLSKVDQLSYEEVGKVMKKSISSVESLLFRAKKNLQTTLMWYYEAHGAV